MSGTKFCPRLYYRLQISFLFTNMNSYTMADFVVGEIMIYFWYLALYTKELLPIIPSPAFLQITNQMIRACQVYISCQGTASIWCQPRPEVRNKIQHCLKLHFTYRSAYQKTKVRDVMYYLSKAVKCVQLPTQILFLQLCFNKAKTIWHLRLPQHKLCISLFSHL